MNYFYIIPLWFFSLMQDRESTTTKGCYFFAVKYNDSIYITDSNANTMPQFKTQIDSGKAVTPDSFILFHL